MVASVQPRDRAESPLLQRGEPIGRYLVLELVGRGAMGDVYAAYDPELDRKVAVKLLQVADGGKGDRAEQKARLLREAQAIARLSHPNVVVVHDVGSFGERIFIAMEFVDGHTLSYWMHAARRSWREIVDVFVSAGRGLAAAHAAELVHRDFKGENVMITAAGQVRVMDFGLARQAPNRKNTERRGGAAVAADGRYQRDGPAGPPAGVRRRRPSRRGRAPDAAPTARPSSCRVRGRCHRDRSSGGNAGVHGARAVPRAGRRRPERSVQLLRRAVRGALRPASVRGHDDERARRQRHQRPPAPDADHASDPELGAARLAARPGDRSGAALAVDGGAAGRARAQPQRARLAVCAGRRRRRLGGRDRADRRPGAGVVVDLSGWRRSLRGDLGASRRQRRARRAAGGDRGVVERRRQAARARVLRQAGAALRRLRGALVAHVPGLLRGDQRARRAVARGAGSQDELPAGSLERIARGLRPSRRARRRRRLQRARRRDRVDADRAVRGDHLRRFGAGAAQRSGGAAAGRQAARSPGRDQGAAGRRALSRRRWTRP